MEQEAEFRLWSQGTSQACSLGKLCIFSRYSIALQLSDQQADHTHEPGDPDTLGSQFPRL